MKNEELSASPIKKQGSAAGGKANYRIENSKSQRSENNSKLLTLNSICHNSSCEPAATELKSKTLTDYHRFSTESLHGFVF